MKFFAVFGDPIIHSKSPRIHNNAIKTLNLNGVYTRYHLQDKNQLKTKLFDLKLDGANITVPFKEQALQIADFKDDLALNIGSANTLLIKENKIYAYNTDALGFMEAIKNFKNIKKVLILGAGGTAKALAYILRKSGMELVVANRSKARLEDFWAYQNCTYDELEDFNFDLIVNSTSAGLKDEYLPCDEKLLLKLFKHSSYAFDVIYGKKTSFLKLCEQNEVVAKDGLDMLLWQGVFAFELFFDINNKREKLKKAMQEALVLS
ncbi:shikimate dehydrogenase [Campylobacter sp. CCS1377]|uniref:Shikimate dehydrogenase (NADP(+)) n=1 Tax=Campylobacter sp. CCS1377 TaxID=3158229 RepID=A0AAU7EAV7_9BACT|nr:shikimate dehydrogenase [Campylobacter jejuni]